MPDYRRADVPGGTYFFTLVTERREPFLCSDLARRLLRESIDACRADRPFDAEAFVLLPDHLHAIWTLPPGDADFSGRFGAPPLDFTRKFTGEVKTLVFGAADSETYVSFEKRGGQLGMQLLDVGAAWRGVLTLPRGEGLPPLLTRSTSRRRS